jgi:hypothetical protein
VKQDAAQDTVARCSLDEGGFAPTVPGPSPWVRANVRPVVADAAPHGRRVNVIGAWVPLGRAPRFVDQRRTTTVDSAAFREFVWHDVGGMTTPRGEVPAGCHRRRRWVLVLATYSVHPSHAVTDFLPQVQAAGIECFFLPPYSPDLNLIAGVGRHVKHEEMPVRRYATAQAVQAAVDAAVDRHVVILTHTTENLLQAA